jgi:hypothetical protein
MGFPFGVYGDIRKACEQKRIRIGYRYAFVGPWIRILIRNADQDPDLGGLKEPKLRKKGG